jgi:hypothetical protein
MELLYDFHDSGLKRPMICITTFCLTGSKMNITAWNRTAGFPAKRRDKLLPLSGLLY